MSGHWDSSYRYVFYFAAVLFVILATFYMMLVMTEEVAKYPNASEAVRSSVERRYEQFAGLVGKVLEKELVDRGYRRVGDDEGVAYKREVWVERRVYRMFVVLDERGGRVVKTYAMNESDGIVYAYEGE